MTPSASNDPSTLTMADLPKGRRAREKTLAAIAQAQASLGTATVAGETPLETAKDYTEVLVIAVLGGITTALWLWVNWDTAHGHVYVAFKDVDVAVRRIKRPQRSPIPMTKPSKSAAKQRSTASNLPKNRAVGAASHPATAGTPMQSRATEDDDKLDVKDVKQMMMLLAATFLFYFAVKFFFGSARV
ncbi:hypothetical protein BC830DRAFT_1174494 [Chytriomyces sp. MP71]|nr:hypothetical protein BC830DRAFT_1174494 [Chytriomyces sp. MP71]